MLHLSLDDYGHAMSSVKEFCCQIVNIEVLGGHSDNTNPNVIEETSSNLSQFEPASKIIEIRISQIWQVLQSLRIHSHRISNLTQAMPNDRPSYLYSCDRSLVGA